MTLPEPGDLNWGSPLNDAILAAQADAAAAKADANTARSDAAFAKNAVSAVGDISDAVNVAETAATSATSSALTATGAAGTAASAKTAAEAARDAAQASRDAAATSASAAAASAAAAAAPTDEMVASLIPAASGSEVSTALSASYVGSGLPRVLGKPNGLKFDGTDETNAFQALINAVCLFGGGEIMLEGSLRCDGQITFPTTLVGTQPRQAPIRITGVAANKPGTTYSGVAWPAVPGLDLRYAGRTDAGCTTTKGSPIIGNTSATAADRGLIVSGTGISDYTYILDSEPGVGWTLTKPARATGTVALRSFGGRLQSFGYGTLEIDHLQLFNGGTASPAPLLVSTATGVDFHHNSVSGHTSKANSTCDEDIVFGGPGHGTSLTSALTAGATYTSLAVRPIPVGLFGNLTQVTIGEGTAGAQTVLVTADVAAGATSIPVASFVASANHTVRDSVYFNDKYVEQSEHSWDVPSGMFQGYRTRVHDNSFQRFRSIRWGGFATSCHVDHNAVMHNCGSTNTATPSTLTTGITAGATVTALAVSALAAPVLTGDVIQVGVGQPSQEFVASADASAGATSVSVTSATANSTYAIGATVVNTTAGLSAFVESFAVGTSVNAIVVEENRIAMSGGYNYAARFFGTHIGCHVAANDIQDIQASTTALALFRFGRGATYNYVSTGMISGAIPSVDDWSVASHLQCVTVVDCLQGRSSMFPQGVFTGIRLSIVDPLVSSFAVVDTAGNTHLTIAGASRQWNIKGPVNVDGNSAGAGTTYFTLGNNSTASDALFTLNPPTGQAGTIKFKRAGAEAWQLYDAASAILFLRDMVNSKMHVTYTAGAGAGGGSTEFNSAVKINGGLTVPYVAKTAAYTVTLADHTVSGDATAGAFSLTLPTAVGQAGRVYVLRKSDASANAVTVATIGGQTINGAATYALTAQYQTVRVQSDGAGWMVV